MNLAVEDTYKIILESKKRAFDEPKWFFETMLNCVGDSALELWQLEGVEAIADVHRVSKGEPTKYNHEGLSRLTAKSCHGPGKTHWLALIMHWWNYCFYGKIVCTAPKANQLKTRLWPRYRKILRGSQQSYRDMIHVDVMNIKVMEDEDWGCIAETASDPENMAGYHDTPQLFLVDEGSARVLDPMYPVIEGALTTAGSVLVIIGNPTRTTGEFYNSHNKRGTMELYYRMHIKPEDSRFVDEKWVNNMVAKYGANSPITAVRVYGMFPDSEDNQLIVMGWMEDARMQDFTKDGSFPVKRMAIDVADGGLDESIFIVGELYDTKTLFKVMYRKSFPQRTATNDIVEFAIQLFDAQGMDKLTDDIVVDSIGVGTGVASNLIKLGYNVVRYKGGSTEGINTKEYRNHRVQSYLSYRDEVREGIVYYDEDFCSEEDWDDYVSQMMTIKTKPGEDKVEDLLTKKEIVRLCLKSPDMPDGTSMMYASKAPEINQSAFAPELIGSLMSMQDF